LYAGRLDADKDVALLLNVVPRLLRRSDVTVTVVGRGKYQDRFARISHPRFTFRAFVRDREALARIYEASDILLAPGRFETFGLSALEAAAAGLVVVGPDAGGTGELLEQMRSPFLFERGNAAAFYEAIDRAAACDLPSMSDRSRALAAGYGTWPDAIGRQIAVYESMAGARSCR
jgi:glycosyltransferase involved in cell wall biosynthesis